MTDDTPTGSDALDEGALLAAYLDGDTDEVTTARLERRLADEDALAGQLDALATTRARLQRLDQVTAPSDVRDRLRARLDQERARAAGTRDASAAPAPRVTGSPAVRPRSRRLVPALTAAAAVLVVALLGSAAMLGQFGSGGANDAAGEAALESRGGTAAEQPQAVVPDSDAAGGAESGDAPAAAADALSEAAAPAKVEGDQDIAARAARLRASPPADLRARERALREGADLPTARLCVGELAAATVDLVDEDGRVALAVSVRGGSRQIVLLDPRTCTAIRTISTQR